MQADPHGGPVERDVLEDNTARLLQAAWSANALPSQTAEQRVRRLLLAQFRARTRATPEFPHAILALLGGLLMFAAAWLAATAGGASSTIPLAALAQAALWANAVCLPVAAAVIVIARRKHV